MFEFHVSRQARDRYQFDQYLFAFNGNVIFANFHAARIFAQKINQKRNLAAYPESAVKAGQINALGLVDEILHALIATYRKQKNPLIMDQASAYLESVLGKTEFDRLLVRFIAEFPPIDVYQQKISIEEYLAGSSNGLSHRGVTLEEILMLWIENKNPAVEPYLELFEDELLEKETVYLKAMEQLYSFFETQPRFGPDQQNLIDLLRAPALASPYSLSGQLEFIRTRWSETLGGLIYRLLSSLDLIKEENKLPFSGPGPAQVIRYDSAALLHGSGGEIEQENFSPDKEWMPHLILLAKNSYVWLDQLSKKYNRPIQHLNDIPDEELDQLARWGVSGLWLIGLWERSRASATIKQWCGNPEAISSAYSLFSYEIAYDLGGESAYQNLRDRAWQRGIRLASDMVPNHMGIDSPWVVEHPDWFVSLNYSPFPSYSFESGDLSADSRVRIQVEDHYFARTDAAVVFKRTDNQTGDVRYVYHGNDGTTMPWNDTAQLNYLNAEVRETVIQTILNVARRFPIIRFDAAMTLAKRHYQRLWFPQPGTGGAIPSRSEHSITKEQFEAAFPTEFWREVVDRVAQEAPDTLLLAEAFWLMEGYFVRTLGMHRVYNSAFMHMLRNEENANYRLLIKNTLEFEPEILKRYVNFMNNPDERTAVDQFGKGDKYFGVCVLMATLPGLPMFGHGQVEGYAEKYGMEFRKAYWDEQTDGYLVERHEREIFPLLHRRWLFSGVENFLLFDFFTSEGIVNEDVLAYSNGVGSERSLVIVHNKFAETRGWIRNSAGFSVKSAGDQRNIIQKTISEGLNLHPAPDIYVIFRDSITNLEYVRPAAEIADKGLFFVLNAYKYHVFVDFREVADDQWHSYSQLCQYLDGRGVPSVEGAMRELLLAPVQQPFQNIANAGYYNYLFNKRLSPEKNSLPENLLDEAVKKMSDLISGINYFSGHDQNKQFLLSSLRSDLDTILSLPVVESSFPATVSGKFKKGMAYIIDGLNTDAERWSTLFNWAFIHNLGKLVSAEDHANQTLSWLDEWQFTRILRENSRAMGLSDEQANRSLLSLRLLITHQGWYEKVGSQSIVKILEGWLSDLDIQRYLGINRYKDTLWFNQESFENFAWWMSTLALFKTAETPPTASEFAEHLIGSHEITKRLLEAEKKSGFQVARLLEELSEE